MSACAFTSADPVCSDYPHNTSPANYSRLRGPDSSCLNYSNETSRAVLSPKDSGIHQRVTGVTKLKQARYLWRAIESGDGNFPRLFIVQPGRGLFRKISHKSPGDPGRTLRNSWKLLSKGLIHAPKRSRVRTKSQRWINGIPLYGGPRRPYGNNHAKRATP